MAKTTQTPEAGRLSPRNQQRVQKCTEWLEKRDEVIRQRAASKKRRDNKITRAKEVHATEDERLAKRQRRIELRLRAYTILLLPLLGRGNKSFRLPNDRLLGFRLTTDIIEVENQKQAVAALRRRGLLTEFGRKKWEPNVQAIKDALKKDNPDPRIKRLIRAKGFKLIRGGQNAFTIDGEMVLLDEEAEKPFSEPSSPTG